MLWYINISESPAFCIVVHVINISKSINESLLAPFSNFPIICWLKALSSAPFNPQKCWASRGGADIGHARAAAGLGGAQRPQPFCRATAGAGRGRPLADLGFCRRTEPCAGAAGAAANLFFSAQPGPATTAWPWKIALLLQPGAPNHDATLYPTYMADTRKLLLEGEGRHLTKRAAKVRSAQPSSTMKT